VPKYLILFGTEHHCYQVDFVIEYYKISPDNLVLVYLKNKNELPNNILAKYGDKYFIEILDNWSFKDLFGKRYKYEIFLNSISNLKSQSSDYILFSTVSYETVLLVKTLLRIKSTYLLDDGFGHFSTIFFFESKKKYFFLLKLFIKSIVLGRLIKYDEKFIYFTEHKYIKSKFPNTILYDAIKVENPKISFKQNEVWFLGTSIVECGLLKQDDYITLLKGVKKNYENQIIIYLPHRNESDAKLSVIESLGFVVKTLESPFEYFYSSLTECPPIFASFYNSAVLYNIKKRFTNIPRIDVYHYSSRMLKNERRINETVFQEYKMLEGINLIEVV
jgi:hypothetical protein